MIYIRISFLYLIVSAILFFYENILLAETSLLSDPIKRPALTWSLASLLFILIFNVTRYVGFKKGLLENKYAYYAEKMMFFLILSVIIIFTNIGEWFYIGFLLPIIITSLVKGPKSGYFVLLCSFVIHFAMSFYSRLPEANEGLFQLDKFWLEQSSIIIIYIMFFIGAVFFGQLYKCGIECEIEHKSITEQLEERCMRLESTSDEMKIQFESMRSSSGELEESNKKLSKSIAEFYTLNQISQAIGSVLDTKELLKRLNDIILGVMGVSYSTIILYDESINRLKVHTTNISNINKLATVTDNINSGVLMDALNKGMNILENNVDHMRYAFTCGRDINSLICIPLNTSSRKYGLVLIEHKYANAFNEENVRMLSIIAQQVGIVMENAELYNKMRELARMDGLTDVYNRQYFRERLEIEFINARLENYPLTLAIFDIDHFKKFNDTYGHVFGDKVLTSIVKAVKATLRKNDIMARYGGEEFTILLPRTNLNEAFEKVESLRKLISNHIVEENNVSVTITASFGISSYDECALNEKDLLRSADDALYEAKDAGRNCVMTAKKLND